MRIVELIITFINNSYIITVSMKLSRTFMLNWKKLLVVILIGIISVILHNFVGAVFNIEEALFFIIVTFCIPIYLITSVIYTLVVLVKKTNPA